MRAGLRSAPCRRARAHAEKFFKDIGKAAKAGAGKIAKAALRWIVTVTIVQLAFFRIGQNLIRFADFLEFLRGRRIILIGVGMDIAWRAGEKLF